MSAVACIGVWDLLHYGHIKLLQKAGHLCDSITPILHVGVVCDEAVKRQKGANRPIIGEKERLYSVEMIKGVSKAHLVDSFNAFDLVKKVNSMLSFDRITTFVLGEDQGHITGTEELESSGVSIYTVKRTPNVSTSDLIKKLGK